MLSHCILKIQGRAPMSFVVECDTQFCCGYTKPLTFKCVSLHFCDEVWHSTKKKKMNVSNKCKTVPGREGKSGRQNRSESDYTIYSILSAVFSIICGPSVIFCSARIDTVSCSLCGLDYYMLLLCSQN